MDATLYRSILGVVASAIGATSFIIYLIEIYRNDTKPHVFSWFLWSVLLIVLWCVQFTQGAGPGAWSTMVTILFMLFITLAAWKKGEKNITRGDWISLVLGLASIPLWYFTKQPLLAVILLSLIDVVAFYPTIRKTWLKPWEEPISMYALTTAKYVVSFFAMEQLRLVNWLYPACIVVCCIIMIAIILVGRQKQKPA